MLVSAVSCARARHSASQLHTDSLWLAVHLHGALRWCPRQLGKDTDSGGARFCTGILVDDGRLYFGSY